MSLRCRHKEPVLFRNPSDLWKLILSMLGVPPVCPPLPLIVSQADFHGSGGGKNGQNI